MTRHIKSWDDITLKEYVQLDEISKDKSKDELEKVADMCIMLYGDFPIYEMQMYNDELRKLLSNEISTTKKIPNKIKIGSTTYIIDTDVANITTAQFMDYREYCKEMELDRMSAVFIIPEGHTYNKGYDFEAVVNDINKMPITLINSLAFFLLKKYKRLLKRIQLSFQFQIATMKGVTIREKIGLIQSMEMVFQSTESLTSFLQSLKKQD